MVGGAGFVGSHLVDALLNLVDNVAVIDNFFLGKMSNLSVGWKQQKLTVYHEDARFLPALESIIKQENPDVIFNLAMKCLPTSFVDPEGAYMAGVQIAYNLAYLLRKNLYLHLIHFSSSEAYGTLQYLPMNEEHPLNPTTPYGAGKAAADLLLLSYSRIFNLKISIIRPFNLYGPRQNAGSYAGVMPLTINRLLTGAYPVIEWDGKQTRDFTYVTDVTEAALDFLDCDDAVGKVVNLGQGKEVSIKQVIHMLCDLFDVPFERVVYRPKRLGDIKRHLADISLAKKLINYSPTTSLKDGLALTADWFRQQRR